MTKLILEEIKIALGVDRTNIGFDTELLMFINSTKSSLIQLGVVEMDIPVDESTEWPTWQNETLGNLVKHYIQVKVRQAFDPTASETIEGTLASSALVLEGRITHETEEVPYV